MKNNQCVWLVLVRVSALPGNTQTFDSGSQLLVQCLFPPDPLPQILAKLPGFLEENYFELIDHEMAEKYRLADPHQTYPTESLREWMTGVSRSGRPRLGMFFYCDAEAQPLG
jgi:hypothetical protein